MYTFLYKGFPDCIHNWINPIYSQSLYCETDSGYADSGAGEMEV